MRIKEIIVVEGKDDTVKIKHAVDADTIETNGSAINEATLERIKLAQEKRGVIVFTDPDYPGERIRNIITQHVPNCKHAFLSKEEAIAKKGKRGLGIEHASVEAIRIALQHAQQQTEEYKGEISWDDLLDAGLIGGSVAKSRREKIGKLLKIGYTNGKQLHKRLQVFQISKGDFEEAVRQMMQEENK
ncbi:ribonuclease M5 [Priestia taiwanensis]|uniref:Ribonuclease M5 n=1 Tax=Priestia taiwanensis TaxID=1347902 RepID=A0A917AXT4_9BACI|nr:ribonuclease M5 [Priestia taiwanensis]MBM7365189.1 ribonuclease M5 [Priestia taiwanensis]GGE84561.1 ribonuclease M5 [Priestia taiwanensis]